MANYINSNILFQSYANVDADYSLVSGGDQATKDYLQNYIEDRAKHFLDSTVSTSLEFKSGSIKAYATVRGTLTSCLPAAGYDFVAAINHLYWFTKRISDAAVMELAFKTGTYIGSVKRTEARPGIIGKTKRIIDQFSEISNKVRKADAYLDRKSITSKFRKLKKSCEILLDLIKSTDDEKLLKKEFLKLLNKLPLSINSAGINDNSIKLDYESMHLEFIKYLNS